MVAAGLHASEVYPYILVSVFVTGLVPKLTES